MARPTAPDLCNIQLDSREPSHASLKKELPIVGPMWLLSPGSIRSSPVPEKSAGRSAQRRLLAGREGGGKWGRAWMVKQEYSVHGTQYLAQRAMSESVKVRKLGERW